MGQYYKLTCPDAQQYVSSDIGSGIKMWEILFNTGGAVSALLILLAHQETPTQSPGDVYTPGGTGLWAGKRPFYIGDYGEDGDLANWEWPISEGDLYSKMQPRDDDDDEEAEGDVIIEDIVIPYVDVSRRLIRALEACSGMAYTFVERPMHYTSSNGSPKTYLFNDLVRNSVVPASPGRWTLPPLDRNSSNWEVQKHDSVLAAIEAREDLIFLQDEDIEHGQRRLIVNLDKKEFIDPVAFGEVPTMAGMMKANELPKSKPGRGHEWIDAGIWTSAQALSCMLFLNERRGGGDIEGEYVGRWRGDRLVVLGDNPTEDYPSHETILAEYEDVSPIVRVAPDE